jgi:hypothetical protein
MKALIYRLVTDPLMRFALLGSLVYAGINYLNDDRQEHLIVIDRGFQEDLATEYAEEYLHTPDQDDNAALVQEEVEHEVLYRQATSLRLDEDDPVIRKRMIQKMRLILEGDVDPGLPDHDTLAAWHHQHAERYMDEGRTTFRTLYFGREDDHLTAKERAVAALEQIGDTPSARIEDDPFLAGKHFRERDDAAIDRIFGPGFAVALAQAPVGTWHGPLVSPYGMHLVLVETRRPQTLLPLEAVEAEVRHEWHSAMLDKKVAEAIATLVARYDVNIEAYDPRTDPGVQQLSAQHME